VKKQTITILVLYVVIAILVICFLISVPKELKKARFQTEQIEIISGFRNPFPLLKIDEDKEKLKGFLDGNFFLGCGSVNGVINQGDELTVWWKKSGKEVIRTSIPYEKIIFVLSETDESEIEFVLYKNWARSYKSLPENPNEVIKGYLKLVKIMINTKFLD